MAEGRSYVEKRVSELYVRVSGEETSPFGRKDAISSMFTNFRFISADVVAFRSKSWA